MTKLEMELRDKLDAMLSDRKKLLAEIKQVRSAVLEDNPKKNKWLTEMIDDVEKLDRYIDQHQNRIEGIKQRQKLADNRTQRKQDTKRKILLGAMLEKWVAEEKIDRAIVSDGLNEFLLRDSDKALFDDYLDS